ncbi:ORF1B [Turkey adenovirus 1]|uniref:ORF1B n=1 Tax=Turkey adenovirus 1 TaxID=878329 RepID=E0YC53_9ADEN|nr:ORF1B [Turkey adenovirus 1]ADM53786.1 ORF1B [Turkey adenovirus 1]
MLVLTWLAFLGCMECLELLLGRSWGNQKSVDEAILILQARLALQRGLSQLDGTTTTSDEDGGDREKPSVED